MEEEKSKAGTVFFAFMAGAALGAGLSLLLTPKSGSELRGTIRDLANDAAEKIRDFTAEAQAKIMETLEEGKEKLMEKKSVLASAIEAGKEAMAAEREKERG